MYIFNIISRIDSIGGCEFRICCSHARRHNGSRSCAEWFIYFFRKGKPKRKKWAFARTVDFHPFHDFFFYRRQESYSPIINFVNPKVPPVRLDFNYLANEIIQFTRAARTITNKEKIPSARDFSTERRRSKNNNKRFKKRIPAGHAAFFRSEAKLNKGEDGCGT